MRDGWTAYINLCATWKASRQSTHSRGPLSATLITLMASNINVLTLSTIFPVCLGSFRAQTHCVNTPAVAMLSLPAIVFAVYPRAAVDEWAAALFGNLALMTRREKWPLLRLEWSWIIIYYLSFSLKTVEPLGRIKGWKRCCMISSGVVFPLPPGTWLIYLYTHSIFFQSFPFSCFFLSSPYFYVSA